MSAKSKGKKRPEFRAVKTVGALVKQLSMLPKGMSLSDEMRVTVFNEGACPEGWDKESWKPVVGIGDAQ